MNSGCFIKTFRRSIVISSNCSIVSKDLLTIGSLVNGHNLSAGCNSGEYGGKNSKSIPSGIFKDLLVCHLAPSKTSKTRLFFPKLKCLAKSFKTLVNISVLTFGKSHQYVFPDSGWTNPYSHAHS